MNIQIDTREKNHAIRNIIKEFERQQISYYSSKLYVGDYMSLDNPRFIIDRKRNLTELTANVCQNHERFVNEIRRAKEHGIELVFLVEHGKNVHSIEDVHTWENPRLRKSPKAVSGDKLQKILKTMERKYEVKFLFCEKSETGKRIIELLGGDACDHRGNKTDL